MTYSWMPLPLYISFCIDTGKPVLKEVHWPRKVTCYVLVYFESPVIEDRLTDYVNSGEGQGRDGEGKGRDRGGRTWESNGWELWEKREDRKSDSNLAKTWRHRREGWNIVQYSGIQKALRDVGILYSKGQKAKFLSLWKPLPSLL